MGKVLFSAVGSHDPFSGDDYDGAMLHIVKHYMPEAVYLFFTTDMLHKKTDCESAVKALYADIKVTVIETDIENAADFDAYHDEFSQIITRIRNENPTADIILNVTSGTAQMSMALCAEVFAGEERLTPIQVDNPKFNKLPNRCKEPGLLGLRKNVLKRQIKDMIAKWDYAGAYFLLKNNLVPLTPRLEHLLHHAYKRSTENEDAALDIARKNLPDILGDLYPPIKTRGIKEKEARKVFDYYQILALKRNRGEITDFTLRANSFAEYLVEKDIKFTMFADKKSSGAWKWNVEKAKQAHPDLIKKFETEDRGFDFTHELNARAFTKIADYFNKSEYGILFNYEFRRYRNDSVHKAAAVVEEDLNKHCGVSLFEILTAIKLCLERIYNPPPESYEIFNFINQAIKNELQ